MSVELRKNNSCYRVVFYENEVGEYATIQVNSNTNPFTVGVELAREEIKRLTKDGYKITSVIVG